MRTHQHQRRFNVRPGVPRPSRGSVSRYSGSWRRAQTALVRARSLMYPVQEPEFDSWWACGAGRRQICAGERAGTRLRLPGGVGKRICHGYCSDLACCLMTRACTCGRSSGGTRTGRWCATSNSPTTGGSAAPHRPRCWSTSATRTDWTSTGCAAGRRGDPDLSAEDVALGYKNLLEAERAFRTMKSTLDLRPVHHRLDEWTRAHVLLCWLALLLIRVAERRTVQPWSKLAAELGRIHQVTLTGPAASGVAMRCGRCRHLPRQGPGEKGRTP